MEIRNARLNKVEFPPLRVAIESKTPRLESFTERRRTYNQMATVIKEVSRNLESSLN